MNVISILGILGSVASILGAYLSIKYKKEAEGFAKVAELAKNEVLKKQKTVGLANLLYEAKSIQQIFGKYSIAQSNRSLTGVDFTKDSEKFQSFIYNFNENRTIIEQTTEINSKTTYQELDKLLNNFSSSVNSGKKENGKMIRVLLDDIIFKMRNSIDLRNEN